MERCGPEGSRWQGDVRFLNSSSLEDVTWAFAQNPFKHRVAAEPGRQGPGGPGRSWGDGCLRGLPQKAASFFDSPGPSVQKQT